LVFISLVFISLVFISLVFISLVFISLVSSLLSVSKLREKSYTHKNYMDHLTPSNRSWNMGRICSKNTKPEKIVRSLLHKLGYRFRLYRKDLPGKPDIILPKYSSIVMVHGCFWHRHKNCKYSYEPKSKVEFWKNKFKTNTIRDKKVIGELKSLGWRVLVIWECETKNIKSLSNIIFKFLPKPHKTFPDIYQLTS